MVAEEQANRFFDQLAHEQYALQSVVQFVANSTVVEHAEFASFWSPLETWSAADQIMWAPQTGAAYVMARDAGDGATEIDPEILAALVQPST